VAAQLRKIAVTAWRIVGGTGYGRVDLRIDERGRPWILEVNANPDFSPTAGSTLRCHASWSWSSCRFGGAAAKGARASVPFR